MQPQQMQGQQAQQQPQQGILPQQLASIAEVLGPLLQQQGIQGLGGINMGQLQQGLGANLAQQGLMQVLFCVFVALGSCGGGGNQPGVGGLM